jgi:exosortase/archaeosortase
MKKNKKENNTAMIGFWLVLGASKEHPLMVCPAIVREKAAEQIESVSIAEAWTVAVQAPIDTHKEAVVVMVPEIINIANLEKPIKEFKTLWEIQTVKAKCQSLATRYIEQFKLANQ